MTTSFPLMAALASRLQQSEAELDSVHLGVLRQQAEAMKQLDALHRFVDSHHEQRELASIAELRERILQLVRSGAVDRLSPREARAAARMIGLLSPRELATLLRARPAVAGNFVAEFFRRWDDLDSMPTRREYAELVVRSGHLLPFMETAGQGKVVTSDGPEHVALAAPRGDGHALAEWLQRQGLSLRWSFTAHVVANVVTRTIHDHGVGRFFRDFGGHPELAGLVLPPLERPGGRWFFSQVPAAKRGSLRARSWVVAMMLNVVHRAGKGFPDELVAALLDSELGDPRVPPESLGWQEVKRHVPAACNALLEELIREDLSLFFEHAMDDMSRRNFWLLYIKSIRRTVCVLEGGTYKDLRRQLEGSTTDVRAALSRVRKFAGTATVSAFCLFFSEVVVVEFSKLGHAAYIYSRADFDRHIEPRLANGAIENETGLKHRGIRLDSIVHHMNWELRAHRILLDHGVTR